MAPIPRHDARAAGAQPIDLPDILSKLSLSELASRFGTNGVADLRPRSSDLFARSVDFVKRDLTLPHQDFSKFLIVLFALLGGGLALVCAWWYTVRGGFDWRKEDFDEYCSTVLRKKDKNGKTITGTDSTREGDELSNLAGEDSGEEDFYKEPAAPPPAANFASGLYGQTKKKSPTGTWGGFWKSAPKEDHLTGGPSPMAKKSAKIAKKLQKQEAKDSKKQAKEAAKAAAAEEEKERKHRKKHSSSHQHKKDKHRPPPAPAMTYADTYAPGPSEPDTSYMYDDDYFSERSAPMRDNTVRYSARASVYGRPEAASHVPPTPVVEQPSPPLGDGSGTKTYFHHIGGAAAPAKERNRTVPKSHYAQSSVPGSWGRSGGGGGRQSYRSGSRASLSDFDSDGE